MSEDFKERDTGLRISISFTWMTTRKYQPPKHNWTDLVHREVFFRPVKPKWNKIHFLQVLRTFRRIWFPIKAYAGQFEQHVKPILGRSVMVAFNCNQTKEVGTSRTPRTWYHGKPSFFQMQYWAPYFSPPEDNRDLRVECMHSEAPRILTAIRFQDLERVVHQHWLCIMDRTQDLQSTSREMVNDHCRRALRRMTLLAGLNWGNEDQLDYIVPWQLGTADAFRVPLPPAVVAKAGSDSLLSAPTILLPRRLCIIRTVGEAGDGSFWVARWVPLWQNNRTKLATIYLYSLFCPPIISRTR